jgi:hypothetical protein
VAPYSVSDVSRALAKAYRLLTGLSDERARVLLCHHHSPSSHLTEFHHNQPRRLEVAHSETVDQRGKEALVRCLLMTV